MSRKSLNIVIWCLFVVVALVGAAAMSGGAPAKDIPMTALFSERGGDKIMGDGGGFYVHQGTSLDVNNVSLSGREGNFVMVVRANSGRFVDLNFDTRVAPPESENPSECAKGYFLATPDRPVQTVNWFLRTYWKCKYIPHEDETGKWTELIRSTTRRDQTMLNLTTMRPGETVAVSVEGWSFRAPDDPGTPSIDESVDSYLMTGLQGDPDAPGSAGYLLITATDWTGDGIMDWILQTIPGRIVIKQYARADDVLPNGDAFHMTCGYPCEYGGFQMPFELKIARR